MLTDKQSLILCGFMTAGVFIFGILDILDNFIILTILTLIYIAVVFNLFYVSSTKRRNQNK